MVNYNDLFAKLLIIFSVFRITTVSQDINIRSSSQFYDMVDVNRIFTIFCSKKERLGLVLSIGRFT